MRCQILFLAVMAVALGAGGAETVPAHLKVALAIATEIRAADNEYAHKDCFIHWKGEAGVERFENRTDCSDFFDLLIEHVYGFTRKQLKGWTGHERPTAAEWYDATVGGKAGDLLMVVKGAQDVLPGDMIFVKYPAGEADTGHVMMVAGLPVKRTASEPVVEGTQQWEVSVVDSSKSGHGVTDTRHNADGTYSRGVGRGVLRLYTHGDGTVAGYAWSTLKVSKFVGVEEHAVVIARLKGQ